MITAPELELLVWLVLLLMAITSAFAGWCLFIAWWRGRD